VYQHVTKHTAKHSPLNIHQLLQKPSQMLSQWAGKWWSWTADESARKVAVKTKTKTSVESTYKNIFTTKIQCPIDLQLVHEQTNKMYYERSPYIRAPVCITIHQPYVQYISRRKGMKKLSMELVTQKNWDRQSISFVIIRWHTTKIIT